MKPAFRLIIAGSRGIEPRFSQIETVLSEQGWTPTTILSGCCHGPDKAGEAWATTRLVPVERYPADWETYGKSAGPRRNREMAERADAALVFWDGKSRGTKNMIDEMKRRGKPVFVVEKPQ